jgi:hypothetical protein
MASVNKSNIDQESNVTEKMVNQITLECLINKSQYDKYLSTNCAKTSVSNKKDKKFYRKRILQLTRDILLNSPPDTITSDINIAFENYAKTCTHYFKMIDKTDIIQSDYDKEQELDNATCSTTNMLDNEAELQANKLMMRSIKTNKYTLDRFVKITTTKQDHQIIPMQKDINLKDPSLRNKGLVDKSISKKKNIVNNYETQIEESEKNK